MKLISWNVNGIKSRYNDGTLNKIFELKPDIFCIQELKQKPEKLGEDVLNFEGYTGYFYPSESDNDVWGVATYTKYKPLTLKKGFNNSKFDSQGRLQKIEFKNFNLYNVYFPSVSAGGFDFKCEFFELFTEYVNKSNKPQVICGDFNRIYSDIDVYNPESHRNGYGFKKVERKWFQDFLDSGYVDTFRMFNQESENYTCWPQRSTFKEENKGYRFDYFLIKKELIENVVNASILDDIPTKDHAPIILELEF